MASHGYALSPACQRQAVAPCASANGQFGETAGGIGQPAGGHKVPGRLIVLQVCVQKRRAGDLQHVQSIFLGSGITLRATDQVAQVMVGAFDNQGEFFARYRSFVGHEVHAPVGPETRLYVPGARGDQHRCRQLLPTVLGDGVEHRPGG